MSKERSRDQAPSDGDNTLVHKHKKARGGSVTVEDKENYSHEEFLSSIEPIIGRSVTELLPGLVQQFLPEIERMIRGLVEPMLPGLVQQFLLEIVEGSQNCACKKQQYGKQVDTSISRSLELKFKNKLSLPIFTNEEVKGENSSSDLTIELVDVVTGQVVKSGPESSMGVGIVVLKGDFNCNEDNNWEPEDFRINIVSKREGKGKKSLLTGSVLLTLKEGVGVAHDIKITDNSKWIPSGKFRLGARFEEGYFGEMRVKEAVTEQFVVREDRGKYYEKHYPPSLDDEVWRLKNISKTGALYRLLREEGISTLKDFLTMLHVDPQQLREILGPGMTNKKWEETKNHAETCNIGTEMFAYYYSEDESEMGVVFDIVGTAKGRLNKGEFIPINDLLDDQKEDMLKIVKVAYENPKEIVPYTTEANDVPIYPLSTPEIPTFSDDQDCGRFLSQTQVAFLESMLSSADCNLQETGGVEPRNFFFPANNANGPIFGSSSNVPVDTVPSPSPRPEIPTVPNQQYYGGLNDSEWQIPFTTSTSILEDYNFDSTEDGHLIYADQDVLAKSLNDFITSSGSNCS